MATTKNNKKTGGLKLCRVKKRRMKEQNKSI